MNTMYGSTDDNHQHSQGDQFDWQEGGWTIQTHRSKIHNNDANSLQWKSHIVWKSELGMTKFRNQDLPEALWGSNLLQLRHRGTNTTLYFCALEALRSWALLDERPIPHASGRAPDAWDYTFTTPYAGSICRWVGGGWVTDDMIQPDGTSVYRAPAENPVSGTRQAVQLRPPLCKCVGGRMLCASVVTSIQNKKKGTDRDHVNIGNNRNGANGSANSAHARPSLPVEHWEPFNVAFDMERLLRSTTKPLYYSKPVFFWVQNLDPQSFSFLMGHVLVANDFMVASLRCFVRVNGVRVRLLGTQFIVRKNSNSEVLRERSWREGTWAEYTDGLDADGGGDRWIDLGTELEQVERAQKRLKHKYPPVVEKLVLPKANPPDSTKTTTAPLLTTVWTKTMSDDLQNVEDIESCCCSSSGRIILLLKSNIVALDSHSGAVLWQQNLASLCDHHRGLSLLSVEQSKVDGKVLIGDDCGSVHILQWPAAAEDTRPRSSRETTRNNDLPQSFSFRKQRTATSEKSRALMSSGWVEKVAWSKDGRHFAAAAGKEVMIDGKILVLEGTVYDICFLGGLDGRRPQLAVAVYGTLVLVGVAGDATATIQRRFDLGASAVLACAVSPDSTAIAVGCMDKRVRLFRRRDAAADGRGEEEWSDKALDWVGFDGRISCLRWSADGRHLAALGGSILLVARLNLTPGEAPVLCSCGPMGSTVSSAGWGRKFNNIVWGIKTNLLVASTDRSLHTFDIHATNDMVLKRCYPIQSMQIEEGGSFVVTDEDEVLVWGRSNIQKIKVG